ncbi:MAG: carbohydrate kinase family protein [Planctomycetota bacterium]|jgi:fructokinase
MTDNKQKHVLAGLGEILWDILPDGKKLGGAPANFAYHAQALGGKGVVVSCVGDDDLGKEILDKLDVLGLDKTHIAIDREHPTGTVTVEVDENGKPDYIIHENVAWDYIPGDSGLCELAGRIDAVCFGSLCQRSEVSRRTVRDFLSATREDCIRVFDINLRQSYYSKDVVKSMLEVANVLKLNDEELPVVAKLLDLGGAETEILSALTQRFGLRMIALTRGPDGSRLFTPQGDSEQKAAETEIADTVGAGDAFTAAIALGLLKAMGLDEINELANQLAAFVCSQSGATPKLPESLAGAMG